MSPFSSDFSQLVDTLSYIATDQHVAAIPSLFEGIVVNTLVSTPGIHQFDDYSLKMLLGFAGLDFAEAEDIGVGASARQLHRRHGAHPDRLRSRRRTVSGLRTGADRRVRRRLRAGRGRRRVRRLRRSTRDSGSPRTPTAASEAVATERAGRGVETPWPPDNSKPQVVASHSCGASGSADGVTGRHYPPG